MGYSRIARLESGIDPYLNQQAARLFVLGEKLAWAVCVSILSAMLVWIALGAVTFDVSLSSAKLIGIRGMPYPLLWPYW